MNRQYALHEKLATQIEWLIFCAAPEVDPQVDLRPCNVKEDSRNF